MAPSPFSLLLRHVSRSPKIHSYHLRHFPLSPFVEHFSLSPPKPSDPPKHSSLSSRFSFVFEQIDEIEKERAEKDDALQRIKAWRESKKPKQSEVDATAEGTKLEGEELGLVSATLGNDDPAADRGLRETNLDRAGVGELVKKEVELVHPWPEWIEFMERLVQQNYFDHRRTDEDKVIEGLGCDSADVAEEGFDFTKDWKSVHTAVLNFGRDRFDIFRYLSRQDIQILVGYGCASTDRKVVFSSKLLRKHVHLDEGDVCSSCSMRSSCDKAYLLTNKEDEARTIDIARVLLTYGFEPINGSVANKSLLKKKSIKAVVCKLLHEVVKHSSVPIDPNLPPPVIKKRPPKVKQPPPPPRRRIGRDDIEMKKGDWLCPKCDFMNFAKNAICLQCDAKRPKRQLLPGEWECPQCNFLNYRRNMACFHCEHKRPPDEYTDGPDGPHGFQERRRGSSTRPERVVNREEFSTAWNFNFDDDESDGADVAAFENADAHEGHTSGNRVESAQPKRSGDDFHPRERNLGAPDHAQGRPGTGFDDFDDEEDDDVDNYELEDTSRGKREETSSVNLSDIEGYSLSDEDEALLSKNKMVLSRSGNKSAAGRRGGLSGSDDDDIGFGSEDDLPVHPRWKSSHVADSRQNARTPRRNSNFDSDEDVGLPSGSDDDVMGGSARSRGGRGDKWGSDRRESSRGGDPKARMNERGRGGGQKQAGGFERGGFENSRRGGYERGGFDSDNDDVMGGSARSRGGRGGKWGSDRRESSRGGGPKARMNERGRGSGQKQAGGFERGGFENSRCGGYERGGFGSDNDDVTDGGFRSKAGRGNIWDSSRRGGLKPRADDRGFSGRRQAGRSERGGFGNSRQGGRGGRFGGQQVRLKESRDEGDFADERPTRARVNVR